MPNVYVLMPDI